MKKIESLTLGDIAKRLGISEIELKKQLLELGIFPSKSRKLLTIEEVASSFTMSERTLRNKLSKGADDIPPSVKFGHFWRFMEWEFLEWLAKEIEKGRSK